MKTPPFGTSLGPEHERRYEELKIDIAERLRPVCAHWASEEFDRLVASVAETTWRYELRTRRGEEVKRETD